MSLGDITTLLLIISSRLVQVAASETQQNAAILTPPAVIQPRADANSNWIGYTEVSTGVGTFASFPCDPGLSFTTWRYYGNCCAPGNANCRIPTFCSSGTIFDQSTRGYCSQGFPCVTVMIADLYDPVATTTSAPSVTLFFCGWGPAAPTHWTAWKALSHVNITTDSSGIKYVANTAAPTTMASTSQSSTPSPSPSLSSPLPSQSSSQSPSPSPPQLQSPSPSPAPSLSTGAIIGIVISASCSIIGVTFGIVFKIYKYRKEKAKRKVAATGLG